MTTKPSKKRGRKPKGGKLVPSPMSQVEPTGYIANVILHLRCRLNDTASPESSNPAPYEAGPTHTAPFSEVSSDLPVDSRTLTAKLHSLSLALANGNVSDKKSACFWDTCNFATPPIHIPKQKTGNEYQVYGCFCSPQCAAAHLFAQKDLDKSALHERYALLNNVYGGIYNYEKNIRPAPDPHYLLDKFYGTLTIDDFRNLLETERVLLVVEAPLTRSLPEIHTHSTSSTSTAASQVGYRLCRSTRPRSKTDQLTHSFGF